MSLLFFTVIIPTYNRAQLIPKAIESVLAQTFKEWELLIIDDGSTDNTKQVVAKYTDPRIKYIYQENAERCAARNNGIEHSDGRYICFLDSDDYYLPSRLQDLFDELYKRNFPVAAFYTDTLLEKEGVLREHKEPDSYRPNKMEDMIALSVIHSQQACIHSTILQKLKYDPAFHIGEDMELWLRICAEYDFLYLANQPTIVVVEHEGQSVNVERDNVYIAQLKMLRYVFSPAHPGCKISPEIKARLISYCYYGMAKYFIYKNQRWQAAAKLVRSLAAEPASIYFKFRMNVFLKLVTLTGLDKIKILIAG